MNAKVSGVMNDEVPGVLTPYPTASSRIIVIPAEVSAVSTRSR